MATYTEKQSNQAPWYLPTGGPGPAGRTTSRQYANGDIVQLERLQKDTKVCDLVWGADRLDTNGAPTMTGVFEIVDSAGANIITLATLSTTHLGSATAASRIGRCDNPSAIGYVVPVAGYRFQFRVTAGPATAAAGILGYCLNLSARMNPGEGPHAPTG